MAKSLFFVFSFLVFGLSSATHILSPKGNPIPIRTIQSHLPIHNPSFLRSKLIEIDNNLTLHTQNATYSLDTRTMTTTHVPSPEDQVVFIDGKRQTSPSPPITIHKGTRFVVVRNEAGSVRFLTTTSSHYVPVDEHKHPGVFIDTQSMKLKKKTAKHQTLVPPIGQLQRSFADLAAVHQSSAQVACSTTSPKRIVELAVVADYETCRVYGRSAVVVQDKLTYLIEETQKIFTAASCLKLKTVRMDIFCRKSTDPYRGQRRNKKNASLDVFMKIFDTDVVQHDIALYLTPPYQADNSVGWAIGWVGCDENVYSWSDAAQEDFTMITTMAHEIGHNIGLGHSNTGTTRGDGGDDDRFSAASAASLRAFLRTSLASCIAREGRQREMIGSSGPRCPSSERRTKDFEYRRVGSIRGPAVEGKRFNVPVLVRMRNGRIFVRVRQPRALEEHDEHGRIDFYVGETTAVTEYEQSGGIIRWKEVEDESQVTLPFPEKFLFRPTRSRSCCETRMTVDVQTQVTAYNSDKKLLEDYSVAAIGAVSFSVECE